MTKPTIKGMSESINLGKELLKLLKDPPPDVLAAFETLGVKESLAMLAKKAAKEQKYKELAVNCFFLGAYIAGERAKLEKLWGKQ